VAGHLRDAGEEPAELASRAAALGLGLERRALPLSELRVIAAEEEEAGGRPRIRGHAAVFNSPSEDLGGFIEVIHPGAFKKTIQEADVRALQNHDPNRVLGRRRAGTLSLEEDDRGLRFEIDPPAATWAEDLIVSMDRGDVDQCSFGFEPVRQEWETLEGGGLRRHLWEVRLFDVSVVTFPAYPETSAEVRAQVLELQATAAPAGGGHAAEPSETDPDLQGQPRSIALGKLELSRRGYRPSG
jgi:HK97 family phage prohead protease